MPAESEGRARQGKATERRIAVVGILVEDRLRAVPKVNEILSSHADMILGRMGVPYREKNIAVIALIVDGTTDEIGSLTGKLGSLPGVKVRSAVTA
ncbi:MAG: iron-only hydrogenase system regulator [Firmicutes bacterium]|nr:iron-only hydrogenase system regulator [Bacillota bacterium]MDH7496439.1 iron-only hydrogenase system regulator [Bacillota bacterium]